MKQLILSILFIVTACFALQAQETRIPPILFKSAPGLDYIFKSKADGTWEIVPTSSIAADGSETIINQGGDISVTGTGTSGDPYVISFSETNTSLSLTTNTLTYTDETGTPTNIDLSTIPAFTKSISGDIVTDNGDQTYTINETTTSISWNEGTRTLSFVDEDGATTDVTIEKADVVSYTYVTDATAAQTDVTPGGTFTNSSSLDKQVLRSGVLMSEGGTRDYTITGGTITFNTALTADEVVKVTWLTKS